MNFQTLSSLWVWLAPAAANHLWQSTLFALAAGVLTLTLRKNQARTRYSLWLAASIKFLVPFDLLMALGSSLAPARAPGGMAAGYFYATEAGQPFNRIVLPSTAPAAGQPLSFAALLPMIVLAVWFCGFAAVLAFWLLRWRRIQAVARQAVPMDAGREVEALRRLECANGIRKPIPLRLSPASLEPGIFGIFRPVLLWPAGISAHLNDAHLEAILAHELRHVRYRDNLTAALHALVQAVFWFHPLVWWMGTRLVQERERGCDEEVIAMGNHPGAYAEGILKACQFCIASPLASFSGVTGADLKQRIVRIMSGASGHRLTPGKKRLLLTAGAAAFAAPLLFGLVSLPRMRAQLLQTSGPLPSFEVATIKPSKPGEGRRSLGMPPGEFRSEDMPLKQIIKFAYNIKGDDELEGAPSWIDSASYDIEAKEDDATIQKLNQLPPQQREVQVRLMVQSLLIDRFQLKFNLRTEQLPVYALVVVKGGPKLVATSPGASPDGKGGDASAKLPPRFIRDGPGSFNGRGVPISVLTEMLGQLPDAGPAGVVLDETGLKGNYNIDLKWRPEMEAASSDGRPLPPVEYPLIGPPSADSSGSGPKDAGPSLFTALEEQLGLKLVSQKGPVEVLVIDHIERPSAN